VRVIVEAHGGTVRADSRIGEGAVFTVELPGAEMAKAGAGGELTWAGAAIHEGSAP